ncbi:hypothetical protein JY06_09445 [Neisseria meningitidis]|uniref:hypothetical protein n=1 Tax=Neisseria meningitidis TaxID=487 RepID=UPI000973D03A|nr:hypothetical protein [Neisseria meningitidis]APY29105.1 hypothetical protein AT729_00747 [Neisseria meningitidis]MBG8681396.1 hypothetical protein [Neisseria meningitidis]MBG8742486.1 hypothetical protein [Neisseria meningitidis]MBG8826512.1 hypothetical protein [Neisseria meningitidis]MBJ7807935.1 hypothetical protein [Neisseria meningitidis]
MTNQFKFGDRVRDTALGLGECVVINASENSVYIMNERGEYNTVAQPETLELVKHPDQAARSFGRFGSLAAEYQTIALFPDD